MKQYLLPAIAGVFALSANIVVAAPRGQSPPPAQKVESKGHSHSKQPEKHYSKGPEKSHGKVVEKSHGKVHNPWNDRIEVRAQVRLQKLGYYRGRIDGDFGRGSRAALVKFQRSKRLKPTGSLDKVTLRALGI